MFRLIRFREKRKTFSLTLMCGGAGGEFSYTIAHRARSLLVWMAKIPSASFSRWHREFSFGMLECSAVSRRKLNLLTHMPENHEKELTRSQVCWCATSTSSAFSVAHFRGRCFVYKLQLFGAARGGEGKSIAWSLNSVIKI